MLHPDKCRALQFIVAFLRLRELTSEKITGQLPYCAYNGDDDYGEPDGKSGAFLTAASVSGSFLRQKIFALRSFPPMSDGNRSGAHF